MLLTPQQRRAGLFEFAIGVPINVGLAVVLYLWALPDFGPMDAPLERIVFTLKCNALPAATMLAGLLAVALGRGTSKAIDPLARAESRTLQIHMRYLTNTHEQLTLFFVSSLALSVFLDSATIRLVAVAAVLFFVNRFVFWLGYLRDPLLRGAGLSGTLYPILAMVVYATYRATHLLVAGN
jgi:uncharacterized MAPEG superfamily protein